MATLSPLFLKNEAVADAAVLRRRSLVPGGGQEEKFRSSDGGREASKESERRRLEQVAQEFEGLFIAQMLKPMFESIGADPLFGGGFSEEAWRSLLVDEYGKHIAANGGLGLSSSVMAALLKTQETAL